MDSFQIPYFVAYLTNDSYQTLHTYNYHQLLPPISFNYGCSFEIDQNFKCEDSSKETRKEDFELGCATNLRTKSLLDSEKQCEDKYFTLPLNEKYAKKSDIKPRQQTANRNLGSNTFKVYFKQLRDNRSETYLNLQKIILKSSVEISVEKFMEKMNAIFPQNLTYICFDSIKRFCSNGKGNENKEFSKIFRISIKNFFKYEIFTVNLKSVRTTRQIRNQQIQQGKVFLTQLFH